MAESEAEVSDLRGTGKGKREKALVEVEEVEDAVPGAVAWECDAEEEEDVVADDATCNGATTGTGSDRTAEEEEEDEDEDDDDDEGAARGRAVEPGMVRVFDEDVDAEEDDDDDDADSDDVSLSESPLAGTSNVEMNGSLK